MSREKVAVVLFNLGAPDRIESVYPFLINLFSDPAIIPMNFLARKALAYTIATLRKKQATENYQLIGGKSPLLENTNKQATALMKSLSNQTSSKYNFKVYTVMRYWHPRAKEVVKKIKAANPDRIVMLPLYPQFSTTTTRSSIREFEKELKKQKINAPKHVLCCYYKKDFFIQSSSEVIFNELSRLDKNFTLLFSAHGIPQSFIKKFGDPYQYQVEETARLIAKKLNLPSSYWQVCYQSRIGKQTWLKPYFPTAIAEAAKKTKTVVVYPLTFVSEHSETLVELDIEYKELAHSLGIQNYIRIPTVSTNSSFIDGLAELVLKSVDGSAEAYLKLCDKSSFGCYRNLNLMINSN